jgi:CheY-like chemotaxis protein
MRVMGGAHDGVLIVEDDHGLRQAIASALEDEGYAVLHARNGQEALELLDKGVCPCVVLLDLMMPIMDGWTLVQEMKKRPKLQQIPVCVISAQASNAPPEAVCVFKKPIDIAVLLGIADTYC